MSEGSAPTASRRLAAIGAILLVAAVIVGTLVRVASDPGRVLLELVVLVILISAAWLALTRTAAKRTLAAVVAAAAAAVVALLVSLVGAEGYIGVSLAIRIAAVALAVGLTKYALGTTTRHPQHIDLAARRLLRNRLEPVHPPFQDDRRDAPAPALVDQVELLRLPAAGVQVHEQDPVFRGGDGGPRRLALFQGRNGDGSQAMVGTVAAEFGLPMVVVPAGTRNHLALDLGLDREDVVGAQDASGEAIERTMDLADVNGHVFVNNVSLGLYAAIVRSPEYRDAKVDTTLATLPQVLGPEHLRWTDRDRPGR
jgi:hypothetical protein